MASVTASSATLIEVLNCPRLQRYARHVLQTRNQKIGIPVKSTDDVYAIAAKLVLDVLQCVIPRRGMRSYLMKIISFDNVAVILREWRSDVDQQTVMHLAVSLYDLEFVKLVAEKCGEDLFAIEGKISKEVPICYLFKNQTLKKYNETDKALEYYLTKVPNGVSWVRSAIFKALNSCSIKLTSRLVDLILAKPIIASEIVKQEKSAVIAYFVNKYHRIVKMNPDIRKKIMILFILSEPSSSNCHVFSSVDAKTMQFLLEVYEEVVNIKQFSHGDKGHLLTLTNATFRYINGYFPDFTKWNTSKLTDHVQSYIKFLWHLDNIDALPKNDDEISAILEGECEVFLLNLFKRPTEAITNMLKFDFHLRDLPPIYKRYMKKYGINWYRGCSFRSDDEISKFQFSFADLPADLIISTCSFLPYRTLVALFMTSKRFFELQKVNTIWRQKFEQYFPYENKSARDYSALNFNTRHQNKFEVTELYGRNSALVPLFCNVTSAELYENYCIYVSKYHKKLSLFNIETDEVVSMNLVQNDWQDLIEPVVARVYNDRVFVMRQKHVEVCAKDNLKTLSRFELKIARTMNTAFELSNQWLAASDCLYDWTTGQIIHGWDLAPTGIIVRDQLCYNFDGKDMLIRDIRQADQIQHVVQNISAKKHASVNVFDGKIYAASTSIDIFDMRYLQQPTSKIDRRNIGPFSADDYFAIDLVNMNVWGSQISWDLVDNQWERVPLCNYSSTKEKICNGKYLAVMFVGVLEIFKTAGSAYFPYGDFKPSCKGY